MPQLYEATPQNRRYDELSMLLTFRGHTTAVMALNDQLLVSISGIFAQDIAEPAILGWIKEINHILILTQRLHLPQDMRLTLEQMINMSTNATAKQIASIQRAIDQFIDNRRVTLEKAAQNLPLKMFWKQLHRIIPQTAEQDTQKKLLTAIDKRTYELKSIQRQSADPEIAKLLTELKRDKISNSKRTAIITPALLERIKSHLPADTYTSLTTKLQDSQIIASAEQINNEKANEKKYLKKLIQSYNDHAEPGHEFSESMCHALSAANVLYVDKIETKEHGIKKRIHAEVKLMDYVVGVSAVSDAEYYIGTSQKNCEECKRVIELIKEDFHYSFSSIGYQETSYGTDRYDLPTQFQDLAARLIPNTKHKDKAPVATLQEDTPLANQVQSEESRASSPFFYSVCYKLVFKTTRTPRSSESSSCKQHLAQFEEEGHYIRTITSYTTNIGFIAQNIPGLAKRLKAALPELATEQLSGLQVSLTTTLDGNVIATVHGQNIATTVTLTYNDLAYVRPSSAIMNKAANLYGKYQLIQSIVQLAKHYQEHRGANGEVIEATVETSFMTFDTIAQEFPKALGTAVESSIAQLSDTISRNIPSLAKGLQAVSEGAAYTGEIFAKALPVIATGFGAYHAEQAFEHGHIVLGIADTISTLAWLTPFGLEIAIVKELLEPLFTEEGWQAYITESKQMLDSLSLTKQEKYRIDCSDGMCSSVASDIQLWVLITKPFKDLYNGISSTLSSALLSWITRETSATSASDPDAFFRAQPHLSYHLPQPTMQYFVNITKSEVVIVVAEDIGLILRKQQYMVEKIETLYFTNASVSAEIHIKDATIIIPKNAPQFINVYLHSDPHDVNPSSILSSSLHHLSHVSLAIVQNTMVSAYNLASGAFTELELAAILTNQTQQLQWVCRSSINLGSEIPNITFTPDSVIIKITGRGQRSDDEIFSKSTCQLILLGGQSHMTGFIDTISGESSIKLHLPKHYPYTIVIYDFELLQYIDVIELEGKYDIKNIGITVENYILKIWEKHTQGALLNMLVNHKNLTLRIGDMYSIFAVNGEEKSKHIASELPWYSQVSYGNFTTKLPDTLLSTQSGSTYYTQNFAHRFVTSVNQTAGAMFVSKGPIDDVYTLLEQEHVISNTISDGGGANDFFIHENSKITTIALQSDSNSNASSGDAMVVNASYMQIAIVTMGATTLIASDHLVTAFKAQETAVFDTFCSTYFTSNNRDGFCVLVHDNRIHDQEDNHWPQMMVLDRDGAQYNYETKSWQWRKNCGTELYCTGSELDDMLFSASPEQIVDGAGGVNYIEAQHVSVTSTDCGISIIKFQDTPNGQVDIYLQSVDNVSSETDDNDWLITITVNSDSECFSQIKIIDGAQAPGSVQYYVSNFEDDYDFVD